MLAVRLNEGVAPSAGEAVPYRTMFWIAVGSYVMTPYLSPSRIRSTKLTCRNNICPTSAMPIRSIRNTMRTSDVSTIAEPRTPGRLETGARPVELWLRCIGPLEAKRGGGLVRQVERLDQGIDRKIRH